MSATADPPNYSPPDPLCTCRHRPTTLHLAPYTLQAPAWPSTGCHVLAQATEEGVVVYQAFSPAIGAMAAAAGRFAGVAGFSLQRMTWVKTNFLWMMYRCGWATKPQQECVLAITLTRPFFERMLEAATPSTGAPPGACRQSDVVLQWDPDHLPNGDKHPGRRAIQLGLRGAIRDAYASGQHILSIEDVTPFVAEMRKHALALAPAEAHWPWLLVPEEHVVVLPVALRKHVGADPEPW